MAIRAVSDLDNTLTTARLTDAYAEQPILGLTIMWHPERELIGEQSMGSGDAIAISRFAPMFSRPGHGGAGMPIGHRAISREPLSIRVDAAGAVEIAYAGGKMALEVNGQPSYGPVSLDAGQLANGIVLGLGGQVFICLHWMRCLPKPGSLPELLGVSSAAIQVREAIMQVAATDMPVLLLGETGCGKEVAARAIHRISARRVRPFVAVNMATLSESLAAADLFGAVKGAYTGAQGTRRGWFAEAEDGTLFLDEIGDTPASVQSMLLRVLENGEYRPLGAAADAISRARLIAATDRALDAGGGFNQALRRRMEAYVIRLPALRERREDIGLLMQHFLHLYGAEPQGVLPAGLLSQICNGDWPGNVRQLAHAMRRIVLDLREGLVPALDKSAFSSPPPSVAVPAMPAAPALPHARTTGRRKVSELSHHDLSAAMEQCDWQILAAAQQLGISRPSLYKLLHDHPHIRFPARIPIDEIHAALQACDGDLLRSASRLMTPVEALRRHLGALGIALS